MLIPQKALDQYQTSKKLHNRYNNSLTYACPICSYLGSSWRRGGEDKKEERERERPKDREHDADGEKGWRVDKENPRRIKNEPDDDGWTTVRR